MPFLYDSFIHYSTPVVPGARHGLLEIKNVAFDFVPLLKYIRGRQMLR